MKLTTYSTFLIRKFRFNSRLWKSETNISFTSPNRHAILSRNRCLFGVSAVFFTSFHTSTSLYAKQFQERENEYALCIMSSLNSYVNTIAKRPLTIKNGPIDSDSLDSSTVKELNEFTEVTQHAILNNLCLEDISDSEIIKNLVQKLPALSDDQLVQILHYICLWQPSPKSRSPNFKLLWNALDFECTHRIRSWDVNRKLLVADYWFYLKVSRISQYNKNLIRDLLENLNRLSNNHVIQLMFCINLQRKVPEDCMQNLEERLAIVIKSVSIEEVGIVCLGFFKTENKITDFNTIKAIISRFCKEMMKVNTISVASILKFLRKSMNLDCKEAYLPLLHKSVLCVPNWDVPTCIHLALLASECHIYHPLLLNTVTEKVASNIGSARIKDCTKLLQCLSHFNHYPESEFHRIFSSEVFKSSHQHEIEIHPRILPHAVLFYAYLGYYNCDLIQRIMEPSFRNHCINKTPETAITYAEIDFCIEIECRNYTGPRLGIEELKILEERRGNLPSDPKYQNMFTRMLTEVAEGLEEILNGKENILIRHILPHLFSPDIIVRLTGKTEPLSSIYAHFPSESVLVPPKDEIFACFVLVPVYSFAFKSQHLTGSVVMKMRQLEKIGYRVACCPFYDVPRSKIMRKKYLKEKLDYLHRSNPISVSMKCGNKTCL